MLLVIIKKELKRVFSDRRLVFSAFILPAISIFVLYSLMGNMIGTMNDDVTEHISIIHVINAPDSFAKYMKDHSMGIDLQNSEETIDSIKDAVKFAEIDAALVFPDNFDESVINYDTVVFPNVDTFYNPSEEYSQVAINRIEYDILSGYQSYLLAERFGGISKLTAFTINVGNDSRKIAEEGKEAGLGMSFMLPMLLNVMLFAGAMGIGIDVIAGEKERGTMATLLLTPVKRETIAFGKVISLGIVASISAASSFAAIIASLPFASELLAAGSEVSLNSLAFGVVDYLMLLVVLVLQVGIFVGLICLVSIFANSVKEAGTYISPVYMLVMISAFATVFTSGDVALYKFAIPVLGNVFAIKEILTFDLSLTEFAVTSLISAVLIGVLLKGISVIFNNERIMFNA